MTTRNAHGKERISVKILDLRSRLIHSSRDFQAAVVSRSSMTDKVIFLFLYSVTLQKQSGILSSPSRRLMTSGCPSVIGMTEAKKHEA